MTPSSKVCRHQTSSQHIARTRDHPWKYVKNQHPPYVPPMPKAKSTSVPRTRKEAGIRSEQAHELAVLQRAVGEPYSGNGMRASQADREIARLKRLPSRAAR